MMQAGRLNDKIVLLKKETVQDELGQIIVSWKEINNAWCSISYKASKEAVTNGVILGDNQVSIRLRWDKYASQLTQNDAMRGVSGEFYSIVGVFPEMASRVYIDFVCKIGVIGESNNNG